MAAKFKLVTALAKMQQVAVLREPFFRYYRYFAIGQGKFFFMVEDMIAQLDERYAVRPEINYGVDIKPVVILLYLEVDLAVTENVALLAFRLLNFIAEHGQFIMVLVEPFKY